MLRSASGQLVWTKRCLESRLKRGGLTWAERQKIDALLSFLDLAIPSLDEHGVEVKGLSEVKGVALGAFVTLSDKGKRIYANVLEGELDKPLVVEKTTPNIVAKSPSGVSVTLTRSYIEKEA